jgi:hypothetical protein
MIERTRANCSRCSRTAPFTEQEFCELHRRNDGVRLLELHNVPEDQNRFRVMLRRKTAASDETKRLASADLARRARASGDRARESSDE